MKALQDLVSAEEAAIHIATIPVSMSTASVELRIVLIPAEDSADPTVEIQRWLVRSDAELRRLRGGMRLNFHSAQKLREALKAIDAWHTAPNSEN